MPLAKLEGINISYKVDGQGEPLVMIMGFGATKSMGMSQVPFFKQYYQVVTFDNRGVGKSDKPPGPYTTKMMADDTAKLMDHIGIEKAGVIGASMGGMIAQELAINYPQKIRKLVLACTYANQDGISGDTGEVAKLWQQNKLSPAALIGLSFNKPFYRYVAPFFGRMGTMFSGDEDKVGFAGQGEACRYHNTLERLHLITAPTLVIVGTKDRVIKPVSSEVIASKIPNSTLVKLEGGSHCFFLEMKNEYNKEILNFLKNGAEKL